MAKRKSPSLLKLGAVFGLAVFALAVVGISLNSMLQNQSAESLAARSFDKSSLKVKVEGGVGTGAFDAPTKLFAPIACPGSTTDATMQVSSQILKDPQWGCDPQAGFTFNDFTLALNDLRSVRNNIRNAAITLTPPAGYSCADWYFHISTAKNGRYKKEPKNTGSGCTAKLAPGLGTKAMFVWFTVVPNAN